MALIEKLTAIADGFRTSRGTSDKYTLEEMAALAAEPTGGGDIEGSYVIYDEFNTSYQPTKAIIATPMVAPGWYATRSSLKTVEFKNTVKTIHSSAFDRCTSIETLIFNDSITSIEAYAFQTCMAVTNVVLPANLSKVNAYCFSGCNNMTFDQLPATLTEIFSYGFNACNSLKITKIPASVVRLNDYAFGGCTGLTELTFEGTPTTYFSPSAFSGCTNLKTINVPWAEGAIAGAPWGATNATINYNYTGE